MDEFLEAFASTTEAKPVRQATIAALITGASLRRSPVYTQHFIAHYNNGTIDIRTEDTLESVEKLACNVFIRTAKCWSPSQWLVYGADQQFYEISTDSGTSRQVVVGSCKGTQMVSLLPSRQGLSYLACQRTGPGVWQLEMAGDTSRTINVQKDMVSAFSEQPTEYVVASFDGNITVYSKESWERTGGWQVEDCPVAVGLGAQSQLVVTTVNGLQIADLRSQRVTANIVHSTSTLTDWYWQEQQLVVGSRDGFIKWFDMRASETPTHSFKAFTNPVSSIVSTLANGTLACSSDGLVKLCTPG